MIERSPIAKKNRSIFLKNRNDIDIFVEDTSSSSIKFYVEFFNNLMRDRFVVSDVFPCGNKKQVIGLAKRRARASRRLGRAQIFIVDGDLGLISGSSACVPGVVQWPVYCVENYLIDENAILEVIDRIETTMRRDEISVKLDFQNWISSNIDIFIRLYSFIFVCFFYKVKIKLMKKSNAFSTSCRQGILDPVKVDEECAALCKAALSGMDSGVFLGAYGDTLRYLCAQPDAMRFVSGKTHIFPLLFERIRTLFSIKFSDASFMQQLAQLCNCQDARALIFREISRQGFL